MTFDTKITNGLLRIKIMTTNSLIVVYMFAFIIAIFEKKSAIDFATPEIISSFW